MGHNNPHPPKKYKTKQKAGALAFQTVTCSRVVTLPFVNTIANRDLCVLKQSEGRPLAAVSVIEKQ